jgi:hypothetical protein
MPPPEIGSPECTAGNGNLKTQNANLNEMDRWRIPATSKIPA